jgi:hypothetical protein
VVSAGALVTTGALALPASALPTHARSASSAPRTLIVQKIASGKKLHHMFRPGGTGALRTEALTKPDDISALGGHIFVGFANGVGPQGEPSKTGNLDSTIVEFTLSGKWVRQWDLRGKVDGFAADPFINKIVSTVNEDAKSSLYTISVGTGSVVHYTYNKPLPHRGGTDAVSIYNGNIFVVASAPGTTGTPAPHAPAVYAVTLNRATKVAAVREVFSITSVAKSVNGPDAGQFVRLALTDPDSSAVVPWQSPRFGGDYMLDAQGDQELIFDHPAGWRPGLQVLHLSTSVDDTAWVTSRVGALYTTDPGADTLDVVVGNFSVGTAYTAVTPCNANSAPTTCPAPGFPANYLGTVNLKTGAVSKVSLGGATLKPVGLIFVKF